MTQEPEDPEIRPAPNKAADLLDILLLSRLWIKPAGGYELRKQLSKEFGIRVSFGTLYPHLKNLEKSKFIDLDEIPRAHSRKKVFVLTPLGKSALKFNALAIIKIASSLRPIIDSN